MRFRISTGRGAGESGESVSGAVTHAFYDLRMPISSPDTDQQTLQRAAEDRGWLDLDPAWVRRFFEQHLDWMASYDEEDEVAWGDRAPDVDERLGMALESLGMILCAGINPLDLDEVFEFFLRSYQDAGSDNAIRWSHESLLDVWYWWPQMARVVQSRDDYVEVLADDSHNSVEWIRILLAHVIENSVALK